MSVLGDDGAPVAAAAGVTELPVLPDGNTGAGRSPSLVKSAEAAATPVVPAAVASGVPPRLSAAPEETAAAVGDPRLVVAPRDAAGGDGNDSPVRITVAV